MLFRLTAVLFIIGCLVMPTVSAAPDGSMLLQACHHALGDGFQGVEGQMCTWYVTPCDCRHGNEELPHVCLPDDIPVEQLARQVITGLENNAELQGESAEFAASTILYETYPCPD